MFLSRINASLSLSEKNKQKSNIRMSLDEDLKNKKRKEQANHYSISDKLTVVTCSLHGHMARCLQPRDTALGPASIC